MGHLSIGERKKQCWLILFLVCTSHIIQDVNAISAMKAKSAGKAITDEGSKLRRNVWVSYEARMATDDSRRTIPYFGYDLINAESMKSSAAPLMVFTTVKTLLMMTLLIVANGLLVSSSTVLPEEENLSVENQKVLESPPYAIGGDYVKALLSSLTFYLGSGPRMAAMVGLNAEARIVLKKNMHDVYDDNGHLMVGLTSAEEENMDEEELMEGQIHDDEALSRHWNMNPMIRYMEFLFSVGPSTPVSKTKSSLVEEYTISAPWAYRNEFLAKDEFQMNIDGKIERLLDTIEYATEVGMNSPWLMGKISMELAQDDAKQIAEAEAGMPLPEDRSLSIRQRIEDKIVQCNFQDMRLSRMNKINLLQDATVCLLKHRYICDITNVEEMVDGILKRSVLAPNTTSADGRLEVYDVLTTICLHNLVASDMGYVIVTGRDQNRKRLYKLQQEKLQAEAKRLAEERKKEQEQKRESEKDKWRRRLASRTTSGWKSMPPLWAASVEGAKKPDHARFKFKEASKINDVEVETPPGMPDPWIEGFQKFDPPPGARPDVDFLQLDSGVTTTATTADKAPAEVDDARRPSGSPSASEGKAFQGHHHKSGGQAKGLGKQSPEKSSGASTPQAVNVMQTKPSPKKSFLGKIASVFRQTGLLSDEPFSMKYFRLQVPRLGKMTVEQVRQEFEDTIKWEKKNTVRHLKQEQKRNVMHVLNMIVGALCIVTYQMALVYLDVSGRGGLDFVFAFVNALDQCMRLVYSNFHLLDSSTLPYIFAACTKMFLVVLIQYVGAIYVSLLFRNGAPVDDSKLVVAIFYLLTIILSSIRKNFCWSHHLHVLGSLGKWRAGALLLCIVLLIGLHKYEVAKSYNRTQIFRKCISYWNKGVFAEIQYFKLKNAPFLRECYHECSGYIGNYADEVANINENKGLGGLSGDAHDDLLTHLYQFCTRFLMKGTAYPREKRVLLVNKNESVKENTFGNCEDLQPGGQPWVDSDGWTCADYAQKVFDPQGPHEANVCINHGGWGRWVPRALDRDAEMVGNHAKFGLVAQQACCACGGGVRNDEQEVTAMPLTYADQVVDDATNISVYEHEYNVTCPSNHFVSGTFIQFSLNNEKDDGPDDELEVYQYGETSGTTSICTGTEENVNDCPIKFNTETNYYQFDSIDHMVTFKHRLKNVADIPKQSARGGWSFIYKCAKKMQNKALATTEPKCGAPVRGGGHDFVPYELACEDLPIPEGTYFDVIFEKTHQKSGYDDITASDPYATSHGAKECSRFANKCFTHADRFAISVRGTTLKQLETDGGHPVSSLYYAPTDFEIDAAGDNPESLLDYSITARAACCRCGGGRRLCQADEAYSTNTDGSVYGGSGFCRKDASSSVVPPMRRYERDVGTFKLHEIIRGSSVHQLDKKWSFDEKPPESQAASKVFHIAIIVCSAVIQILSHVMDYVVSNPERTKISPWWTIVVFLSAVVILLLELSTSHAYNEFNFPTKCDPTVDSDDFVEKQSSPSQMVMDLLMAASRFIKKLAQAQAPPTGT